MSKAIARCPEIAEVTRAAVTAKKRLICPTIVTASKTGLPPVVRVTEGSGPTAGPNGGMSTKISTSAVRLVPKLWEQIRLSRGQQVSGVTAVTKGLSALMASPSRAGCRGGLIRVKAAATAMPVTSTQATSIRAVDMVLPARGLSSGALGLTAASSQGGHGPMLIALGALSIALWQKGREAGQGSKVGLTRRTLLSAAKGLAVRDRPSGSIAS